MRFIHETETDSFTQFDKSDYQVALVIAEIRRSYVKNPRAVKLADVIKAMQAVYDAVLEGLGCKVQKKRKKLSVKERTVQAKQRFATALGLKQPGDD